MLADYILRRRRKSRQDYSAFDALLATPGDLLAGVKLPARATVLLSTTSTLLSPTLLVDVGARSLGIPSGAANAQHVIGSLGPGATVVKRAGAPGTVSLWIRTPAGSVRKIAQG